MVVYVKNRLIAFWLIRQRRVRFDWRGESRSPLRLTHSRNPSVRICPKSSRIFNWFSARGVLSGNWCVSWTIAL